MFHASYVTHIVIVAFHIGFQLYVFTVLYNVSSKFQRGTIITALRTDLCAATDSFLICKSPYTVCVIVALIVILG